MGLSKKIIQNIANYNEETDLVRKQVEKTKGKTYADSADKIVKNII